MVGMIAALLPLLPPTLGDSPRPLAIVDVTVLDPGSAVDRPRQTVLVRGDQIERVAPYAEVVLPADALRVDGAGRFLLPGLIEDHVHVVDERELLLYLAHGVTTVRNLKGSAAMLDLRRALARGKVPGPRFLTSGPFTNEPDVRTPDQAEAAAREQARLGYDCIRIHGDLGLEAFERLVSTAEEVGLPVVGHVPRNQLLSDVLAIGGLVEIAHAEELLHTHFDPLQKSRDLREIPAVVSLLSEAGAHVTPTLVAYGGIADQVEDLERVLARPGMALLPPLIRRIFERDLNKYVRTMKAEDVSFLRRSRDFQARLVLALHRGGVPILLGTDAMNPAVVPGASIRVELGNLVAAGLSPREALAAGTAVGGRFLAQSPPLGRIAEEAAADAILLAADPTASIENLAAQVGVVARGRWWQSEELERRVAESAASCANERPLAALVQPGTPDPLLAAIEASPPSEAFLSALSELDLAIRQPPFARRVAERNSELHSGSARVWNRLADARAAADDREGAAEAWRRSLALDPDQPLVQALLGS